MKILLTLLFCIISMIGISQKKFTYADSTYLKISDRKINKKITEFSENSKDVIFRKIEEGKYIGTNSLNYICTPDIKGVSNSENKEYKDQTNGKIYFTITILVHNGKVLFKIDQVKHVGKSPFGDILDGEYPCRFCNFDCVTSEKWCDRVSTEIKEMIKLNAKNTYMTISECLK